MKKFLWILFVFAVSFTGLSQQLPHVYNQFFMNPYVYNPAYAGVEGHTVLFFMYKNQFSGIDGGPSQMHANFHVPLKGGIGIGAMAYNESDGLFTLSGGKFSASYLISVDREHFFRFGMSLGAGSYGWDFTEFDSRGDGAFDFMESGSFLTGDVGATYHFGHFNIGVSLPNLFENNMQRNIEGFEAPNFQPHNNMLFKINYRGHINDDLAVEPHILYRYNKFLPNQYEATVIFHLLHIVWVGGSYRQDAGFVGLIGAKFLEKIGVGYSYEYGNPNTASLLGPTHEVHLGYHLGSKKQHAEHVSSFIKSHRKSADVRAKEAELERQRKLQALKQTRQTAPKQEDEDALGLLAVEKPKEEKPDTHWSYEKESEPIQRVNKYGEVERGIKFDRINEKGEKEVVFSWLPPPPPGSTEETYEIASPDEEPLIRTRPDGTREAGIKWTRTIDGGEPETLIIWNEIISEAEAEKLDHNEAEAHELGDAKITIRREEGPEEEVPVETEPVETTDEIISEPEVVTEDQPDQEEVEKGDPTLTDDFRSPEELAESNEPQVVRRGGHMLELPAGNYVVAGVFESFDNAENFSDQLFERGFHDTKVGYLTARGYYYVVIYQSDNLSRTVTEKNKMKNRSGLENVWVLSVNE